MRHIFRYMRPYAPVVAWCLFFKIIGTLVELAIPFVLQHMLKVVAPQNDLKQIIYWGSLMILFAAAALVFNIVGNRLASRVARDVARNVRHDLFDKDAICLGNTGNTVTIKTDKDSRSITVQYPDTPWCALWHKVKMEVPFLCIEPWFSLPGKPGLNEIDKREDFFRLESGKNNCHRLFITINGDTSL